MQLFSSSNFGLRILIMAGLTVLSAASRAQTVVYAGSDTVYPVAEAALTSFMRGHAGYKPQMKDVGTGPGIKELCAGRAVMAGASRPMKAEESKLCLAAGVQAIEVPIALDAVVLVVSAKNTWLKDLTLAEASKAFDSASAGKITSWKQIRAGFQRAARFERFHPFRLQGLQKARVDGCFCCKRSFGPGFHVARRSQRAERTGPGDRY
jgi:ABC-type phosphate transport system substrate-binding protein